MSTAAIITEFDFDTISDRDVDDWFYARKNLFRAGIDALVGAFALLEMFEEQHEVVLADDARREFVKDAMKRQHLVDAIETTSIRELEELWAKGDEDIRLKVSHNPNAPASYVARATAVERANDGFCW